MNTLWSIRLTRILRGNDGRHGKNKNKTGANGPDIYYKVPMGTVVYDGKKVVCDITDDTPCLIAKGGRGGRGNVRFKSAKNTAPNLCENGTKGESKNLNLVLKVLADIGFVGKPSAGKSTLLSKVSNAKPKIADYDFTTLTPQLGFVITENNSFVAADLPGLIKGASLGKGLGISFLKHIERCRVIAHVVDFGMEGKDPIKDYIEINKELLNYNLGLDKRRQVVIANKSDLPSFEKNVKIFNKRFPNVIVVSISAMQEKNIFVLKEVLFQELSKAKEITYEIGVEDEVTIELEADVVVKKLTFDEYEISGVAVKRIYEKIPLNTNENFMRFNRLMKDIGVWDELKRQGVKSRDMVRIFDYEFQWEK